MYVISTLARRLFTALGVARDAMGRHTYGNHVLGPLMGLVWTRMLRLLNRFDRLVLLWERDRLPAPRAPRPARARKPAAPAPCLPTANGWLLKLVPPAVAGSAFVTALLADPETRALVEAAPQAGRILRPLARLLGAELPDYLRLPRRKRKPAPPKPPRPESRTSLLRRLRGMTPAELAAWFHPLPPHFNLPIPGYQKIRRKIRAFYAAGGVRPIL